MAKLKAREVLGSVMMLAVTERPDGQENGRATSVSDDGTTSTPLELFGIRLGALRRKRDFGITELSEQTKISTVMLFNLEVGNAQLSEYFRHLPALAKAFKVSTKSLTKILFQTIDPEFEPRKAKVVEAARVKPALVQA